MNIKQKRAAMDELRRIDRLKRWRRIRPWLELAYAGIVCVAVSSAAVYFVSKLDAAFR